MRPSVLRPLHRSRPKAYAPDRAMDDIVGGLVIVALGLFTFGGGYYQWPWFMNNHKARFVVTVLSKTGARVFYMIVGAFFIFLGVLAMFSESPAR